MEMLTSSFFWVTLAQIMMINIVLSGDNAVVIALASRSLPPKQQKQAILFGSFGAIVLRIILTFFAVLLLGLPFLKIIGARAARLDRHPDADPGRPRKRSSTATPICGRAIKTIIVADFVMSLDNVLGVAAAAKGNVVLLVIGLAISIPLIIYGSTLILKLMNRFPIIITIGGGMLGWVAGEMLVTDPASRSWVDMNAHWLHTAAPVGATAGVVVAGKWLAARSDSPRRTRRRRDDRDRRERSCASRIPLGHAAVAHPAERQARIRAVHGKSHFRDARARQLAPEATSPPLKISVTPRQWACHSLLGRCGCDVTRQEWSRLTFTGENHGRDVQHESASRPSRSASHAQVTRRRAEGS